MKGVKDFSHLQPQEGERVICEKQGRYSRGPRFAATITAVLIRHSLDDGPMVDLLVLTGESRGKHLYWYYSWCEPYTEAEFVLLRIGVL